MEVSGQLHSPAALITGKEPPVPLGGPQDRYGFGSEYKNFHHCLSRELNPGRPARSLVCILT